MATWPSGKAEACKAFIPQFESGCRLLKNNTAGFKNRFIFLEIFVYFPQIFISIFGYFLKNTSKYGNIFNLSRQV